LQKQLSGRTACNGCPCEKAPTRRTDSLIRILQGGPEGSRRGLQARARAGKEGRAGADRRGDSAAVKSSSLADEARTRSSKREAQTDAPGAVLVARTRCSSLWNGSMRISRMRRNRAQSRQYVVQILACSKR